MNMYSDEVTHKRGQHPGWAVRFEDGSWQGGGHGYHRFDDAFYAERHETQEAAHYAAKQCQEDYNDQMSYVVISAWEPLAEVLRHDVSQLKHANSFHPDDIFEITMELESILYRLKEKNDH